MLRVACLTALVFAGTVCGQQYPTKPVRIIIPYPPGGVDISTRLLMPAIEKELGQPWVLEYRSGAGGVIGQDYVAKAAPDGYTLLVTLANSWTVAPAVRKHTPYNPLTDFTPISLGIEPLGLLVAHPSFPANSLTELIDHAKKNPGKAVWATSGIGSSWHMNGEMAKIRGNFDILHAPYQGFGQMIPAVLGGQVPLMMITWSVVHPMITGGKVKLLGMTNSDSKFKAIAPPGTQSFADMVPGYEAIPDWVGLAGPAGLPQPIVSLVHAAYVKALRTPEVVQKMEVDKTLIVASTPEVLAARVRAEYARAQSAVKLAGIPLQE
jgi:tripartite-type tricarboxylate transporter receptor subunit TctC